MIDRERVGREARRRQSVPVFPRWQEFVKEKDPGMNSEFLAESGRMTNGAKRVVIVGATSAIEEATARIWATQGARLVLVGRDEDCLDAIAMD
jgi:hypothetical protein